MQSIKELISSITDGSRAAHAFVLEGQTGEARSKFLSSLAAGLLCSHPDPAARPCGRCPVCRQVAAGTSPDVIRMTKSISSGRSGRETYKTDDAAAFIERLSMGAYGRHLIGIVDDADLLSETIQNKLLKTLEEPAAGTIILLAVSNRDNLLSTVRSRCAEVRLARFSQDHDGSDGQETDPEIFKALIDMIMREDTPFCDYRAALDRTVKTREDALSFLGEFESICRNHMLGSDAADSLKYASVIEMINTSRMDIRRDMNHTKALKRLFLEIR